MSTLVYLCHFGNDIHGDFLVTAVTALQSVGKYQGDILIFTDNYERVASLIRDLPNPSKVGVVQHDGSNGIFTRYNIARDLVNLYSDRYTDFIYMDNDIVCVSEVENLLNTIQTSDRGLHVFTRNMINYYNGRTLSRRDPATLAYGANYTGPMLLVYGSIFAFKATPETKTLFDEMCEEGHQVLKRYYSLDYDVSLFSFKAFHQVGKTDLKTIGTYTQQVTSTDIRNGVELSRPLVRLRDFIKASDKLVAMQTLLKQHAVSQDDITIELDSTLNKG